MLFFSPAGSAVGDDFSAVTLAPVPQTDICSTHCSTPSKTFIICSAILRCRLLAIYTNCELCIHLIFWQPCRADFIFSELWCQMTGDKAAGWGLSEAWRVGHAGADEKKKDCRSYVVERMAVCSTLSPNLLSCCSPSPSRGWALQHKRGSLYLKATGEIKEKGWHFFRCRRPERFSQLSHNSQFILFHFIYLFFGEKWEWVHILS